MSVYRGEDAVSQALTACQENEQHSGGHSWGFAAVTDDGLEIGHGLGEIPPYVSSVCDGSELALGHTRHATRGEITLENAHPFPVYDAEGEAVAALAHNGTWYEAPDDGRCDSYHIARLLETMYRHNDEPFEDVVRDAGEITGETITVIHRDGRAFAYAGRFGITTDGEAAIRSSGEEPIRPGRVVEL
ncbi:class II glutamine amidotransferase [Natronosalvus rutilus]|uniref:Class II glutamine amidotransferase n=1 Tax=Natronosalvus rutilus TaxID=2953753 RepID=A0A9E7SYE6_9EURY|nr:class II glutamine amidotransferase [Natronosalvus rutilus]UTF55961.1 class II glutamine amidotransferase [Natronosalvus rutilus]